MARYMYGIGQTTPFLRGRSGAGIHSMSPTEKPSVGLSSVVCWLAGKPRCVRSIIIAWAASPLAPEIGFPDVLVIDQFAAGARQHD
jgi:hypothetical protein